MTGKDRAVSKSSDPRFFPTLFLQADGFHLRLNYTPKQRVSRQTRVCERLQNTFGAYRHIARPEQLR